MPKYTARRIRTRNIKRRATKKRGGMDPPPQRASSNPPPHDNRRQPVILSSTSSYHSAPPTYNETYLRLLAESPEMGTQSNRASSSNMGTQSNEASSSNMGTQSNRASSSNMGTQTNQKNVPMAAAVPVDLEPYIQTYVKLYQDITSDVPWSGQYSKQVGDVFKQRLANIVQPIIAIYGVGSFRQGEQYGFQGGGSMISYIITNMGIYGITVIKTMIGYVVSEPFHIYQFTNELTPAMRSILKSYSREPFFHWDSRPIAYTLRKKFQSLYMGIPGQQIKDESQIGL